MDRLSTTLLAIPLRVSLSAKFKNRVSANLLLYLAANLVECLHFLHYICGLAHLDLKPDNLMVNKHKCLSLIDFDHCASVSGDESFQKGTEGYLAPERQNLRKPYNRKKADIFSFGIILFALDV